MKNSKSKIMIIASVMTLCIASAAFAQFGNEGGPQQCRGNEKGKPPKPLAVMDSGTTGVYVLEGPKFTKFDSASLAQLGQLELGISAVLPVTITGEDNSMQPPAPPVPGNFKIDVKITIKLIP